jgi:hypothetical protein
MADKARRGLTLGKSNLNDFLANGVADELREAGELKLQHHASAVAFHRTHTDAQLFCDLPIAFALGQKA